MLLKAFTAFLLMGSIAQAAPLEPSQDQMVNGLNTIEQIFHDQYAMQDWKKGHLGFDLAKAFDQARSLVTPTMTLKEYQRVLKKLLNDMNDYHVSIHFDRTERATLPLTIRSAEGHYFLAYVDRTKLSQAFFPYDIGDEVLEFNGHPVDQEIQAIRAISYGGVEETDQGLAELQLTSRSAATALDVPRGPMNLKIRSRTTGAVSERQLIWDYTPEQIQTNSVPAALAAVSNADDGSAPIKIKKREMLWGEWSTLPKPAEENPIGGLGTRKSYVPALGAKIWESDGDANFHAYIFRSPAGHLIGYIRIPHYMGDETWVTEFADVIAKMETTTDALVIDEINNPGGTVLYLYALASLLTQQPLYTPHHRMKITASNAMESLQLLALMKSIKDDASAQAQLGNTLGGYPVNMEFVQFMRSYAQFVVDQWRSGNTLTDPYFLYGVDKINPYAGKTTYSKPILLLINQLDFSGGDFFPAILQDNQRVTVFGTRTAGAGGYIVPNQIPNELGIDMFVVTGSIARRLKDQPIENLGVTPDISYSLTVQDFTTGFAPYKASIVQAVDSLVK